MKYLKLVFILSIINFLHAMQPDATPLPAKYKIIKTFERTVNSMPFSQLKLSKSEIAKYFSKSKNTLNNANST